MISDVRIKVSVCVPVYKVEACVKQCARSIFEQTMKVGIEFIFVDDCSPDGSVDAIKRVLADYPERQGQVRFIHNAVNSGASVTRNNALEASAGEYVLFVDADDVLESDWAEWAIAAAERTDAGRPSFVEINLTLPPERASPLCTAVSPLPGSA